MFRIIKHSFMVLKVLYRPDICTIHELSLSTHKPIIFINPGRSKKTSKYLKLGLILFYKIIRWYLKMALPYDEVFWKPNFQIRDLYNLMFLRNFFFRKMFPFENCGGTFYILALVKDFFTLFYVRLVNYLYYKFTPNNL